MMAPWWLATVVSHVCVVDVDVLSRFRAQDAEISSGNVTHRLHAQDNGLQVDGRPVQRAQDWSRASWNVKLPNGERREYQGSMTVGARKGILVFTVHIPLEEYVAHVVASETAGDTPPAALQAQAIVSRSYALASGRRHENAALCDLAHCQVMLASNRMDPRQLEAARAAVQATAGMVLRLKNGSIAQAPFHASCGGHTADPQQIFGGTQTGAAAVADGSCPAEPWQVHLPRRVVDAAVHGLFTEPFPALEDLLLVEGAGGHVVRVVDRMSGQTVRGDVFARALDGASGHGVVRSGRFRWSLFPRGVLVEGSGHGHGVGLCQNGAAQRAAQGETVVEILKHYYPHARMDKVHAKCGG